jgi:hypothetical protein
MPFIQSFFPVGLDPQVDITAPETPVSALGSMCGQVPLI